MSPPRWVDEQGRERPTRLCPRCGTVIPLNRRSPNAGGVPHRPALQGV